MQNPINFYHNQQIALYTKLKKISRKIVLVRAVRFFVFIATCAGIYRTFTEVYYLTFIGILGLLIFSLLVLLHQSLKEKRDVLFRKIELLTTEMKALDLDFSTLPKGDAFKNVTHHFSHDIDLFGTGSFFQYLNRTITNEGQTLLATLLTNNCIKHIERKQDALKELSEKPKWRHHFLALEAVSLTNTVNISTITEWIQNYTPRLTEVLLPIARVFSVISLILICLLITHNISFTSLLIWFFFGLLISLSQLKKTQHLYTSASNAKTVFKQYHLLLSQIENENFTSLLLKEHQENIGSETKKASTIFKEFSRIIDAFDQRNNMIITLLGNGLFLWDILNARKTEQWILKYKHTVDRWFNTVSFFDAHISLANFVFNHPTYVFPKIRNSTTTIAASKLGHPLLESDKRVDNNFVIQKDSFFIVTGANMAGKSTFLRSVSLAIMMANAGLPVCAESFKYSPIKLITSMRTSDSLSEDESYFYAELKRLKFIINTIKTEPFFIILDEILKGTNSKDKAIGSQKFIEKLTRTSSTGIIATHDVSLCELATHYNQIENYYFDAHIITDELLFDYKLKAGICTNMNASFLLKKMDIID